jgi:hypothetical protein
MDILNKIDLTAPTYSPALTAKLRTVTKTSKHKVRLLTNDEAAELGNEENWFMFAKRQCVLSRRECGQWTVWAF